MSRRIYFVVRQISTDELRISPAHPEYKPQPQEGYTWGGPYRSKRAAERALAEKSSTLRRQLYPEVSQ